MNIRLLLTVRPRIAVLACALCCLAVPCARLTAQADKPAADADKSSAPAKPTAGKDELPPLPPEAHAQQTIDLAGKTLHYTVTVGALPVRDKDGKEVGRWWSPPTPCPATTAP